MQGVDFVHEFFDPGVMLAIAAQVQVGELHDAETVETIGEFLDTHLLPLYLEITTPPSDTIEYQ